MIKTMWIGLLPENVKSEIEKDLKGALESMELDTSEVEDALQDGMDSRLCDLSDALDIEKYIDMLPQLDDGIVNALKYLQRHDSNGSYVDMISEYQLDDIDLNTIKHVCNRVLGEWLDNTGSDDYEQIRELQDMLLHVK